MQLRKFRTYVALLFLTIGSMSALYAQGYQEHYEYTAHPTGSAREEHIKISLVVNSDGYFHSEIVQGKVRIERTLESTNQGRFSKGIQKTFDSEGHLVSQESLIAQGQRVVVERKSKQRIKKRYITIPREKLFAVDASLLYLLRAFPFGTESIWNIFMVDYSGRSVAVEVHQTGQEKITVPAGTFDCYKMEVTVYLWFARPRVYVWLTTGSPHFLVKQTGKRGPFSPFYITELTGVEK